MAMTAAGARDLANAYRDAINVGSQEFRNGSVDDYVLRAMVAASAADTLSWITLRVRDGDQVAAPLADLAGELARRDALGKSLKAAQSTALSKARSAVTSLIVHHTAPLWLVSALGFIVGILGISGALGQKFGGAVLPVILGGAIPIGAVVLVGRAATGIVGSGAMNLYGAARTVGLKAEALFQEKVSPARAALFAGIAGAPPAVPVIGRLRGTGTTVVVLTFILLGVAFIFFAIGIVHALVAYEHARVCQEITCFG
jgi:hypothetical protein